MYSQEEAKAMVDALKSIVDASGLVIEFREPNKSLKDAVTRSFPLQELARAEYVLVLVRSNYPSELKIVRIKDRNASFGNGAFELQRSLAVDGEGSS